MRPSYKAILGPDRSHFDGDADGYRDALAEDDATVRIMLDRIFGVPQQSHPAPERLAFCSLPCPECLNLRYAIETKAHGKPRHLCTRWPLVASAVPKDCAVVIMESDGIAYETCDRFKAVRFPKRTGRGLHVKKFHPAQGVPDSSRSDAIRRWLITAVAAAQQEQGEVARAARGYANNGHADDDEALLAWLRKRAHSNVHKLDRHHAERRERQSLLFLAMLARDRGGRA